VCFLLIHSVYAMIHVAGASVCCAPRFKNSCSANFLITLVEKLCAVVRRHATRIARHSRPLIQIHAIARLKQLLGFYARHSIFKLLVGVQFSTVASMLYCTKGFISLPKATSSRGRDTNNGPCLDAIMRSMRIYYLGRFGTGVGVSPTSSQEH